MIELLLVGLLGVAALGCDEDPWSCFPPSRHALDAAVEVLNVFDSSTSSDEFFEVLERQEEGGFLRVGSRDLVC